MTDTDLTERDLLREMIDAYRSEMQDEQDYLNLDSSRRVGFAYATTRGVSAPSPEEADDY